MIFNEDGKFHIAWHGAPLEAWSGYGASNDEILKALPKAGIVPHLVNKDPQAEECAVGVAYAPLMDSVLEMLPNPYRIIYSMFEADRWPAAWVETCNAANQVWVPSEFCRESLVLSGCSAPVHVVPLGVNTKIFRPKRRAKGESFVIGYAGAATDRKGYPMLLEAFQEEFSGGENVVLRIASSNILSSSIPRDSRIEYVGSRLSAEALRDYYCSVDLFVLPTKGEGFGLTPLEAMACGCCTAVTGWGGSLDYMGSESLSIGVDRLEPCNGYHGSDGRWAVPSMSSLRYVLRWAYENQAEVRERGRKLAQYARSDWGWEWTADAILRLLSEVNPEERVEIETVEVVVWRGSPRKVTTPIGGFVRGVERQLTPEQSAKLDPNDTRFSRERRYRRKTA